VLAEDRTTEILVLGEKGKSQLQRDMRSFFVGTVNDTGKARITFAMVSLRPLPDAPPPPTASTHRVASQIGMSCQILFFY